MATQPARTLIPHVRQFFRPTGAGGLTDAELLTRFTARRDKAAFELLVWRHGPMVLRVCRRVLRDDHAAEDAFQASFLTLACKAGSIGKQESVGSWLYKVAYRVALRAAEGSARQAALATPLRDIPSRSLDPAEEAAWHELGPLLDAEVRRLPEKYRAAFILCCLEGRTNEEASRELGCPKGTVLSRLARARERLRKRLERRGLLLSSMVYPVLANGGWSTTAEPTALVAATVRAAAAFVRDPATSGIAASTLRLLRPTAKGWAVRRPVTTAILVLIALFALVAGIWMLTGMGNLAWGDSNGPSSMGSCH